MSGSTNGGRSQVQPVKKSFPLTFTLFAVLFSLFSSPASAESLGCHIPGTEVSDVWIPILPNEMLFEDDFESGTFDKWDQADGFELSLEDPASGGMSARASNNLHTNLLQLELENDKRSLRFETEFKMLSSGSGQQSPLVEFKNLDGEIILSIVLLPSGTVAIKTRHNLILNTDYSIDDAEWHTFQLDLRPGKGQPGKAQLWIDRAKDPSISYYLLESFGRVSNVVFGGSIEGHTSNFAIDNVKLGLHTPEHLNNEPASLVIQSVPPTEGIGVALDGCEVRTGVDGFGNITVDYIDEDYREQLTFTSNSIDADIQYEPGKLYWRGNLFARVTIETINRVNWQFIDPTGHLIQPAEIDKMTIKSSIGSIHEFQQGSLSSDTWLKGRRIVPGQGELLEKEIYYTIQSVEIDGQNVVNRSQQKFLPSEQQTWEIELLFFPATFHVRDALFGFSQGSAIVLEYPDGSRQRHELEQGQTSLVLPRGDYDISVEGWGLKLSRPLAMTRSQEVNLQLLSYLDLLVIAGVAALIVITPITAGRPWVMQRFIRRKPTPQNSSTRRWKIRGMTFVLSLLVVTLFFSILITRNRQPDRTSSESVDVIVPFSQED